MFNWVANTDFNFEYRAIVMSSGIFLHVLRVIHTYGIDRRYRLRLPADHFPYRIAGFFGFQIPQRAIDGIAGAACRHELLQFLTCNPVGYLSGSCFDLSRDGLQGFSAISNAGSLATACVIIIRYFAPDYFRVVLHAA